MKAVILARGKSDQRPGSSSSSSSSVERLQKMPGPSTQDRPRAHRLTEIESQTKVKIISVIADLYARSYRSLKNSRENVEFITHLKITILHYSIVTELQRISL